MIDNWKLNKIQSFAYRRGEYATEIRYLDLNDFDDLCFLLSIGGSLK